MQNQRTELRVGIINLNKLLRIRKSFRLRWRVVVTPLFLFWGYAVWVVLVSGYARGDSLLPDESVRIQTWVFFTILCIIAAVAFFRKDDFARLFFAIASGVAGFFNILMAVWPMEGGVYDLAMSEGASPEAALGIILVVIWLSWQFLILRSYVLWLSLIPYGPGRAFRQQVIHSLRALSAGKKKIKTYRKNRVTDNVSSKKAFIRFLTIGSAAVVVCIMSWALASLVSGSDDLAKAIHNREYSRAIDLLKDFKSDPGVVSWEMYLWSVLFLLFGQFNLAIFSFLWHRWRRSRIPIDRASVPQRIPPSSLLLFRHSKDDVMRIPRRNFKLSRLPFVAFDWNYTFEELMAERLAFVGPLYSLGMKRDETPLFSEPLERLKSKIDERFPVALRWISLGIEHLLRRLPAKLAPPGASRLYLDDEIWRAFIKDSMLDARALIVVIGSAKENRLQSAGLREEMEWIKDKGYLEKTIFLMPPLLFDWMLPARWTLFTEYMLGAPGFKKKLPKAKRVLGVCFHRGEPVIITCSERSELSYESALDIAGTLAGTTSEQRGMMIMKQKKIALPHRSDERAASAGGI